VLFLQRNALAVVLLKKMQLGVMGLGDYSTALEYGPLMLRVGFATTESRF
jgi:hypothetical protein